MPQESDRVENQSGHRVRPRQNHQHRFRIFPDNGYQQEQMVMDGCLRVQGMSLKL